jgi:hypothetical protein
MRPQAHNGDGGDRLALLGRAREPNSSRVPRCPVRVSTLSATAPMIGRPNPARGDLACVVIPDLKSAPPATDGHTKTREANARGQAQPARGIVGTRVRSPCLRVKVGSSRVGTPFPQLPGASWGGQGYGLRAMRQATVSDLDRSVEYAIR